MASENSGVQSLLDDAWRQLVAGGSDVLEHPAITLGAPVESARLPSHFRVAEAAVACVGVALQAAAALMERRSGGRPTVSLDPGHVGAAVRSERYFRLAGDPAGPGFAPLSRFWRCGEGWVRTHANYPWHKAALLETLRTEDDPEAVAAAMAEMPARVIEDIVVAAGGVAAAMRSATEWADHPQGRAVLSEPLIGHRVLPGASPRSRLTGQLPASGIRVLDLTRVIAGPVCTRYLGALGADVLRVDPPRKPDMSPGSLSDTLLAKRSASLDLDDPRGTETLHDLVDGADAVVCGYRPGSLDRFGLSPDELAARHPGLVIVYLNAWGHQGPWATRRGFDSIVQAATGIAVGEGSADDPGALPCQLLDHGTGYLAAAAVLDGISRQMTEGGTHVRTLSLARTGMWLIESGAGGDSSSDVEDPTPWLVELGEQNAVVAVAPPGMLGGRPLRWSRPPARYMSDVAGWSNV